MKNLALKEDEKIDYKTLAKKDLGREKGILYLLAALGSIGLLGNIAYQFIPVELFPRNVNPAAVIVTLPLSVVSPSVAGTAGAFLGIIFDFAIVWLILAAVQYKRVKNIEKAKKMKT